MNIELKAMKESGIDQELDNYDDKDWEEIARLESLQIDFKGMFSNQAKKSCSRQEARRKGGQNLLGTIREQEDDLLSHQAGKLAKSSQRASPPASNRGGGSS